MEALGWKPLASGSPGERLAVLVRSDKDRLDIYLTDLASLWCEKLSATQILARCQQLNPLIESTAENLIQQLVQLLKGDNNIRIEKKDEERIITLRLSSTLDVFSFNWEFHLEKQNAHQFGIHIVRPMLAVIQEASAVEEELCTIIRNKDKEIDEYKASGAIVSRRHLETDEFNKERYFSDRRMRKVDEVVKADPVITFCQVSSESNARNVFKRAVTLLEGQPNLVGPSPVEGPPISAESSALPDPTKKGTQPARSFIISPTKPKDTEASRREALQKRLQEEELEMLAKKAKKIKKPL